jgi:hypothetical protein
VNRFRKSLSFLFLMGLINPIFAIGSVPLQGVDSKAIIKKIQSDMADSYKKSKSSKTTKDKTTNNDGSSDSSSTTTTTEESTMTAPSTGGSTDSGSTGNKGTQGSDQDLMRGY